MATGPAAAEGPEQAAEVAAKPEAEASPVDLKRSESQIVDHVCLSSSSSDEDAKDDDFVLV